MDSAFRSTRPSERVPADSINPSRGHSRAVPNNRTRFLQGTSNIALLGVMLASSISAGQDIAAPLTLPTPVNTPATLTVEQLREGVQQYHDELWGLEVEYEYQSPKKGIPWMKFHFAMKGEKRLRDQAEADGKLYGEAYNAEDAQIYNRSTKIASIEKQKQTWTDLDFYADAIGIGVSDEDRAQGISLTAILENPALEWSVQPSLETVDGAECHVLVSGSFKNRVWIDPELGFAMRFQEIHQAIKDTPKEDWPLQARYHYQDFEETAPGVHLPRTIKIEAYANASAPKSLWGQITFSQLLTVKKLNVGHDVADDLFRFKFLPGTTVMDRVGDRFYRIGNTGEELDVVVGKGSEELAKSRSNVSPLLILNGVLLAGFLAVIVYRKLRHKFGRSAINRHGP